MSPEDVKNYYGSGYRFALDTGMSNVTLLNWLKQGFVSDNAQCKLEKLTEGALKADLKAKVKKRKVEDKTVTDAKKCLKSHIKFLESLLRNINRNDEALLSKSMWTSWCIHQYMQNQLMTDVKNAILKNAPRTGDNPIENLGSNKE
jgi:hypothetical protein